MAKTKYWIKSKKIIESESNLRVIKKLADTFDVITGFSDHFEDIFLVHDAISLGARVIEKHVTLNRAMKGTDHAFSLELIGLRKSIETYFRNGTKVK